MIEVPRSWSAATNPDGSVVAIHPDGPSAGAIQYLERIRPLATFRTIVRAATIGLSDIRPRGRSQELATDEGELGAYVALAATRGDVAIEAAIGCVFLDDFYALAICTRRADAVSGDPVEDVMRSLLMADAHMLGVRRRWYRYTPPATWAVTPAGPFHRLFTRADATLVGFPALPRSGASRELGPWLARRQLASWGIDETCEPSSTSTRRLSGLRWDAVTSGPSPRQVALVVLEDARYAYPLAFADTTLDEVWIRRTIESIEPIPSPRTRRTHVTTAHSYYD